MDLVAGPARRGSAGPGGVGPRRARGHDDDDDDNDDASGDDDDTCADYRAEYPGGDYGFSVGSVLADPPGMVDGDGNSHSFLEIYEDRSKIALVIANAFDT